MTCAPTEPASGASTTSLPPVAGRSGWSRRSRTARWCCGQSACQALRSAGASTAIAWSGATDLPSSSRSSAPDRANVRRIRTERGEARQGRGEIVELEDLEPADATAVHDRDVDAVALEPAAARERAEDAGHADRSVPLDRDPERRVVDLHVRCELVDHLETLHVRVRAVDAALAGQSVVDEHQVVRERAADRGAIVIVARLDES